MQSSTGAFRAPFAGRCRSGAPHACECEDASGAARSTPRADGCRTRKRSCRGAALHADACPRSRDPRRIHSQCCHRFGCCNYQRGCCNCQRGFYCSCPCRRRPAVLLDPYSSVPLYGRARSSQMVSQLLQRRLRQLRALLASLRSYLWWQLPSLLSLLRRQPVLKKQPELSARCWACFVSPPARECCQSSEMSQLRQPTQQPRFEGTPSEFRRLWRYSQHLFATQEPCQCELTALLAISCLEALAWLLACLQCGRRPMSLAF